MFDAALEAFGAIDILCNVAGIDGGLAPLADHTEEHFERVIGVNLRGVFLAMKYAIPHMLARGKGAIVNVSSAAGLVAMPAMGVYGASKAGVIQLTKSAALEYSAHGIRCNAICPGPVDTPMIDKIRAIHPDVETRAKAATPIGRMGQPAEVAAAALFLASDDASFVTGVALPVDGGYVVP
jgi:NAD(P)-dependent dehydrogenase (short-subunit alcohol dehydrogenase family)